MISVENVVPVLPGAEPFAHRGDGLGFLLCHGFTGSPQSLRDWAKYLADAGHTVSLPRLPGHGTRWQEMNRTTWQDWYGTVDEAFRKLRAECPTVVVGGLSMGGALALRLAAEHGADVAGLVLVNPAVLIRNRALVLLPVLRRVTGSIPGIGNDVSRPGVTELAYDRTPLNALASMLDLYRVVRGDLPRIDRPLLVLRSAADHVVPAESTRLVLERVTGPAEEIVLPDSFHVATLDHDAPTIFRESVRFAEQLVTDAHQGDPADDGATGDDEGVERRDT